MRAYCFRESVSAMMNVLLVIHIIACVLLTGFVLIQKSEGGGLGMGGGGGGGNALMSGRGAASAIMRMTLIVGCIFFGTSLALTSIVSRSSNTGGSIYDTPDEEAVVVDEAPDMFDNSVLIDQTITTPSIDTPAGAAENGDIESDDAAVEAPETPSEVPTE